MLKLIAFLAMLSVNSSYQGAATLPRQELYCLATTVYHEARGEPVMGQVAVAHAVLNRVRSNIFPSSVCEVVYQPMQFSYIHSANPDYNTEEWDNAVEIAVLSYIGFLDDPTGGADHFYAHRTVTPDWAPTKQVTYVIANHTYLR